MTFGGGEGIWQQLGAPLPAYPVSMLTGALAARGQFLLFDSIGATLWVAVGLALGWLFSPAIEDIVATLSQWGGWGLMLVAVAVALFIVAKWWQRHRFNLQPRKTGVRSCLLMTAMARELQLSELCISRLLAVAEAVGGRLGGKMQDLTPHPLTPHPP